MIEHEIPIPKLKAPRGSSKLAAEHFLNHQGKAFELTELQKEFGKSIFTNQDLRKHLAEAGFCLKQFKSEGVTKMWIEKVKK
jgi:hypothetical protein